MTSTQETMMNTLSTLAVSLATLATLAACGVAAEERSGQPTEDSAIIRIAEWNGADDLLDAQPPTKVREYTELLDMDADGEVGGICACDTAECVQDYVLDTYGCAICIDALCDDKRVGGCYACPDDNPAPIQHATPPNAATHATALRR